VQLRGDTGYKVLKWVPRDSVAGMAIGGGTGELVGFLEEKDAMDASTDDDEDEDQDQDQDQEDQEAEDDQEDEEMPDERSADESDPGVGPKSRPTRGKADQQDHVNTTTTASTSAASKGQLKKERKTTRAVEDTERDGGQLAGLETGQIAEQVEMDEDEEEEEQEPEEEEEEEEEEDMAPPPAAGGPHQTSQPRPSGPDAYPSHHPPAPPQEPLSGGASGAIPGLGNLAHHPGSSYPVLNSNQQAMAPSAYPSQPPHHLPLEPATSSVQPDSLLAPAQLPVHGASSGPFPS